MTPAFTTPKPVPPPDDHVPTSAQRANMGPRGSRVSQRQLSRRQRLVTAWLAATTTVLTFGLFVAYTVWMIVAHPHVPASTPAAGHWATLEWRYYDSRDHLCGMMQRRTTDSKDYLFYMYDLDDGRLLGAFPTQWDSDDEAKQAMAEVCDAKTKRADAQRAQEKLDARGSI